MNALKKASGLEAIGLFVLIVPVAMFLGFWVFYGFWWVLDLFIDFSDLASALSTQPGQDLSHVQRWWLSLACLTMFWSSRGK